MKQFFEAILGNLVLNKGPQDIPFSNVLMRLSLLFYFISGLPGLLITASFADAALAMTLDVVVLLLFSYLCLQAFSKSARYVQTITALATVGAVFQLAVLPLLLDFQGGQEATQGMLGLSLLVLMLVSWNLAVFAHIFKESFGIRLPAAMVITICYVFITLLARKIFFPELA